MKASDGKRYLAKFDGVSEGPRPTSADVISTRIFHAVVDPGDFLEAHRVAVAVGDDDRTILVRRQQLAGGLAYRRFGSRSWSDSS